MLAFLAHHGIDANPHDTGLQLHDQIVKELGTEQDTEPDPEPEPEEKQEPKSYAQMPEAQIKMVERMNELIISGNASAKSYAAQMLNLGTRRPTPDEAEAWLACYDDAMADLQQKSEGKDPFSGQF
jgi:ABC-type Fe3+-hydroxamate transport system substrate-binding protein